MLPIRFSDHAPVVSQEWARMLTQTQSCICCHGEKVSSFILEQRGAVLLKYLLLAFQTEKSLLCRFIPSVALFISFFSCHSFIAILAFSVK